MNFFRWKKTFKFLNFKLVGRNTIKIPSRDKGYMVKQNYLIFMLNVCSINDSLYINQLSSYSSIIKLLMLINEILF
jgi:hypothetical protein